MIELDDGPRRIVPILFLAAANRQHMIEAKAGVLLPELQHRLQLAGRQPNIDDVLGELHLRYSRKDVAVSVSDTSQSRAAAAVSRACGMIRACPGVPRNSPSPPGP